MTKRSRGWPSLLAIPLAVWSGCGSPGTTGPAPPTGADASGPQGSPPPEAGAPSPSSGSTSVPLDADAGDAGDAGGAEAGNAADGSGPTLLAATPPMGWNTWNTFRCNISESLIVAVADVMVSSGMQAAGYQYVNLDDCWMNGRDASGNLRWDATKFPSGLLALAATIHAKGLKFGIYETPNTVTCVGIYGGISPAVAVGSLGHETADANTFASWGVDLVKYDLCKGNRSAFATMRAALLGTGRPILYSINPGNGPTDLYPPTTPGWNLVSNANMWRIGFDIAFGYAGVTLIIDQDAPLWSYAGPGHWNDDDIMNVGRGMSPDEDRSHFSMWAMLASPLLAGNDIRSMSAATQSILTNADVIAVNQDPLGHQAQLVATPRTSVQIWSKTLVGQNVRAVALLNRSTAAASVTVPWTALGLPAGNAAVRDLWTHIDLGTFSQSYTATSVPSHGVAVLRVASTP